MSLPPLLQRLRIPVIGAPMFIAGKPKLVIERCKAGIVGSFPALNARPKEALEQWLTEIEPTLAAHRGAAPYAVDQIVHKSNDRLEHDLAVCIRHKVPIASGNAILAALVSGADLAYIGTRFLATPEASVPERYKEEILRSKAADIVYTDLFSGVHGNYLRHSVAAAGFDPLNLPPSDRSKMNFGSGSGAGKKVWRDIWSAGQGVGQIDRVQSVAEVVAALAEESAAARRRLQFN